MTDHPRPGPAALLDGLSTAELLEVATAVEHRLHTAALAAESDDTLLDLVEVRESVHRMSEVFDAALLVEISDRMVYRTGGYKTLHQLYAHGLRLGEGESRRRRNTAAGIGGFTALTGEKLDPTLPACAAAVAEGVIGREHVAVIADVLDKIPAAIADAERGRAEEMLVHAARTLSPSGTAMVGTRILAHLDPDGDLTDDQDRHRRRSLVLGPQNRRLESKVRALLTPALRAQFEMMLGLWAVAGMNNPDDPDSPSGAVNQPGLDAAVLAAAAERDHRTIGQRQHDALLAMLTMLQSMLDHDRTGATTMSSQIVITVSDEDLARQAGIAWTATGTRLPVADLVDFAAEAVPYLAVFAGATSQVLYLGRANRFASHAQRLALFARDRGCTAPGCSAPFSRTQAHHMPDWADGGVTDIDRLGGACGGHKRWNGTHVGQWESTVLTDGPDIGRVGWRPVGRDGPWLVNPLFHPDKLGPHTPTPQVNHGLGPDTAPPVGSREPDAPASHQDAVHDTDPAPPAIGTESGVETLLTALLAS